MALQASPGDAAEPVATVRLPVERRDNRTTRSVFSSQKFLPSLRLPAEKCPSTASR